MMGVASHFFCTVCRLRTGNSGIWYGSPGCQRPLPVLPLTLILIRKAYHRWQNFSKIVSKLLPVDGISCGYLNAFPVALYGFRSVHGLNLSVRLHFFSVRLRLYVPEYCRRIRGHIPVLLSALDELGNDVTGDPDKAAILALLKSPRFKCKSWNESLIAVYGAASATLFLATISVPDSCYSNWWGWYIL